MISLYGLLIEVLGKKPKALLLAGAPGSGKSSILGDIKTNVKILNIDDIIIDLSKKDNFTLNQKATDNENRSKFMRAMQFASKKLKTEMIPNVIKNKESFILDGTSASVKNTLELKDQLEAEGYEVMMLYVYADLETILKRNERRFEKSGGTDRSLIPAFILNTWNSLMKNYDVYKNEFDNFISVSNLTKHETLKDLNQIIKKYVEPFNPSDAKPKTPKEIERYKKQKEENNKEIQQLLNSSKIKDIINASISKEEAYNKIKQFFS